MKCAVHAARNVLLRLVRKSQQGVYGAGGAIERAALAVPIRARPVIAFALAGFHLCLSVAFTDRAVNSSGAEAVATMALAVAALVWGACLAVAAVRLVR